MADLNRNMSLLLDRLPAAQSPAAPAAFPAFPAAPSPVAPAPTAAGFDGVTDPELLRLGQSLQARMEAQINSAFTRIQQTLDPVSKGIELQIAQQQEARGRQMAEALSREFPAFADADLGSQYLQQFVATRQAEPWKDPRLVAQSIQDRHNQMVTRWVTSHVNPAVAPGTSPVPGAHVPPTGPGAPLVRPTAPKSAKEAGAQVDAALAALQQQRQH